MKITNITSYATDRTYFVKIETDEGINGFGECSPMDRHSISQIIHKRLKPKLVGMNVFDSEKIEEAALTKNYKISGQLLAMAYSGIDIALWDIKGKYLKQPVYNLLGGLYRDSIDFYGSSLSRDLSVEMECMKISQCIQDYGFHAVKIKVGRRMGNNDLLDFDHDIDKIKAIRETIGDKCKLMLDANGSFTFFQAEQFYRRIEKYDILQYEEPCCYFDQDAYAKLGRKIPATINIGEQEWNLISIKNLIEGGGCHICAADVTKCGGLTAAKRIAALCRAYGILYGPHNTSRAIGMAAMLHVIASSPECNYYHEFCIEEGKNEMESFLKHRFVPIDGKLQVPSGIGIGVELDEERMSREMFVIE